MSCASGTIAVGEAFHVVRDGRADIMLAGGAEAPLAPLTFAAFSIIRAMSTRNDDPARASRPFDASPRRLSSWRRRRRPRPRGAQPRDRARARIYAEIVGHAYTNDAYHMTAPRSGRPPGRAGHPARARRRRRRTDRRRLHQRARLVHAAQRSDGDVGDQAGHSAITPIG